MNIFDDERVVMTLDAGGTNLVFSAIQGGEEITDPIIKPSYADDLDRCLFSIVEGFRLLRDQLTVAPEAISFAFPGPADYQRGIIGGDLPNFQSFKHGVPLGPMLEEAFDLPTYINNDGNLFALGEAIAGFLPGVNGKLLAANSPRIYQNLIGVTLGTGFGAGIVTNQQLVTGDNSASGEIWLTRNGKRPELVSEGTVSIESLKSEYMKLSADPAELEPKEIYQVAMGEKKGSQDAAQLVFKNYAIAVADALANALALVDGLIVIGGGISGAADLLLPHILDHLNGAIQYSETREVSRAIPKVYNAENESEWGAFANPEQIELSIPFTDKKVNYTPEKSTLVGVTTLGTSKAIAIGAYYYALNKLEGETVGIGLSH